MCRRDKLESQWKQEEPLMLHLPHTHRNKQIEERLTTSLACSPATSSDLPAEEPVQGAAGVSADAY